MNLEMNNLIQNIIREETDQSKLYLKGIDITVSILKKYYPFIIGWELKNEYTSFFEIDVICDINKTSEFYDSPILPEFFEYGFRSVPYPHWLLDLCNKLNEDENFALYRDIKNELNEIYDEIPNEFKKLFGTAKNVYLDITIDRFIFVNPEKLEESKRVNLKEKYKIPKDEFVELYRDNDFILTIPLTHEASKKYGSDTKWCTTTKECSKKFEDHTNLGVLGYITIRDKELKNKLENNAFALYRLYGDDVNRTIVFDDQNNEYRNGEQWLSNKFDRVDKLFQFYKMFRNFNEYFEKQNVKKQINESEDRPNKEIINNVVNELILPNYKDVICDIEYIDKDERLDFWGEPSFNQSRVTITFIGEKPLKIKERDKYDNIMNEIWDTIHDYVGISVDLYARYSDKCEKENINESKDRPNYLGVIEKLVTSYKDREFVCDVEVLYDEEDDFYVVTLWFDPEQMGERPDFYVKNLRKELTTEIKNYLPIDNIYVGSGGNVGCSKKRITENKIPSSDYNSLEKVMNLVMEEKYDWWKDIKINNIFNWGGPNDYNNYTNIEAEITVDEDWGGNQWNEYNPHMEFPGNKGWEDNEEYELVSLGDIIGSNLANEIRETISEVLKYTLGIEINTMSFRNLMLIFE